MLVRGPQLRKPIEEFWVEPEKKISVFAGTFDYLLVDKCFRQMIFPRFLRQFLFGIRTYFFQLSSREKLKSPASVSCLYPRPK